MRRWLWVGLLAGALLAACQPAAPPAPTSGAEPSRPPDLTPTSPAPTVGSAPTPTARASLEATDPTTVSLEDGGPIFVEFFAFW